MANEFATREMKDAQLGFSAGLKTKMDNKAVNNDLDDILGKKLDKIERKQIIAQELRNKNDQNYSRLSSSPSPNKTRQKTPLDQSVYMSAERLTDNSPLKPRDSPLKGSDL